ncbi:thermonuclease family protein [Georhizobium sp. MAB10]|uniref:thermonuclease family protein n=1 Tax=Georhizobium sp. MAB10 TaxID=3028319 RepID=UPI003855EF58
MGRPHHLGKPVIKRFLRSLILPVTLIACLLIGLFTAMDYFAALEVVERPPQPAAEISAEPKLEEPQRRASPSPPSQTNMPRPVDPDLFGQPFTAAPAELERIEARQPISEPPPPREEPKPLLYRPLALSAGLVSISGRNLALEGIVPTPADRFCPDESGQRWPCGMMARTAFRNFLRGRALACDLDEANWEGTATANCMRGETDIAAWLVTNGWVDAEPGSAYAELADAAREARIGIHGSDPR